MGRRWRNRNNQQSNQTQGQTPAPAEAKPAEKAEKVTAKLKSMILEFLGAGGAAAGLEATKTAASKAQEALHPDGGFMGWWQRKEGEPLFSLDNILKAFGVAGGVAVYNHVDPFPESKVDNAIVYALAAWLSSLLVIPQSTNLGSHFQEFEGNLILELKKKLTDKPEEFAAALKWLHKLDHRQERQLVGLFGSKLADQNLKDTVISILASPEDRKLLGRLLEPAADPKSVGEVADSVKAALTPFFAEIKAFDQKAVAAVQALPAEFSWIKN